MGNASNPGRVAPRSGLRERHHRAIWTLLWPVRAWFTKFPIHRGKGLLYRNVILPALPPAPTTFAYELRNGCKVDLFYREGLGAIVLFAGDYEDHETHALCGFVQPGTTAIDAGANIGLCSLEFSGFVGASGQIIAFEPHPGTASRLRANLARNGIANVIVEQAAVGNRTGSITFHESSDATLSSATVVPRDLQRSFEVPLTTIDTIWQRAGTPKVSALKIDVEGGELAVLQGALMMLASSHPAILLEAWGPDQLAPIESLLAGLGYHYLQPEGFEPRNYLFVAKTQIN